MDLCHRRSPVGFLRPTAHHKIPQIVRVDALLWVRSTRPGGTLPLDEPRVYDLRIATELGERNLLRNAFQH